ncbi:hypothetical protein BJX99DRAFT_221784 [Aspergillus californicus]
MSLRPMRTRRRWALYQLSSLRKFEPRMFSDINVVHSSIVMETRSIPGPCLCQEW